MLTADELRRVAELAQADIHDELHGMWGVVVTSHISPGMVRAIVRVLTRDYGIRRGESPARQEVEKPQPVQEVTLPPDLNGKRKQVTLLKSRPAAVKSPQPAVLPTAEDEETRSQWAKKLELAGDSADLVGRLEDHEAHWRTLSNEQRWPIIAAFVRRMKAVGLRSTQAEADRARPWWMPTSQSWCNTLGVTWTELVAAAKANQAEPPASKGGA